jgi:hypothetical protein
MAARRAYHDGMRTPVPPDVTPSEPGERPARRWQLRTWTKGTGATVEPEGARDRPPDVPMREGRPDHDPPRGPRAKPRDRAVAVTRHDARARRRLAERHLDPDTVRALERLERELEHAGAPRRDEGPE